MYYQEKVIDGVLCYKTKPDGDWKMCTLRELTKRLMEFDKTL